MGVLDELKPEGVFKYFEEISNIPRPSYHEKAISDYLVSFAKEHGLEYYQDELFNVIMIKEASLGYENVAPVIIQGHMDMVCEKESDCIKDMMTEGLDLYIDGDFIAAKGTTLGADDGIAVAMGLAVLADETIKHPRIELVITVSEEVGMDGVAGIDVSMLKGKQLINLDSEEEDIFLAGCAGGSTVHIEKQLEECSFEGTLIEIYIDKCTGGHSGTEIDKQRANATLLANRMLTRARAICPVYLFDIEGGSKDNAIPRSASCRFFIDKENTALVEEAMAIEAEKITLEYELSDPDMEIECQVEENKKGDVFTKASSDAVINMINSLPNGVVRMSLNTPGLTETSLNLGVTRIDEDVLKLGYCVRSNVDSAHDALVEKMYNIASMFDVKISEHGKYPAWEFNPSSTLMDRMVATYKDMFNINPKIETMHAGVECGQLAVKIKGLECVSIGPKILDIHTPQERLSISSTVKYYDFLVRMIETK